MHELSGLDGRFQTETGVVPSDGPDAREAFPAEGLDELFVDEQPDDPHAEWGLVPMAEHPRYSELVEAVTEKGFDIRPASGHPHVVHQEITSTDGRLLRTDRHIAAPPDTRFIDLEHEVDHLAVLFDEDRFPEGPPLTERWVEHSNGKLRQSQDRAGVLTSWQDTALELHCRLGEYQRLAERGVPEGVLTDHSAQIDFYGRRFDKRVTQHVQEGRRDWVDERLPDLAGLRAEVDALRFPDRAKEVSE